MSICLSIVFSHDYMINLFFTLYVCLYLLLRGVVSGTSFDLCYGNRIESKPVHFDFDFGLRGWGGAQIGILLVLCWTKNRFMLMKL
jgi:hypothetical protein